MYRVITDTECFANWASELFENWIDYEHFTRSFEQYLAEQAKLLHAEAIWGDHNKVVALRFNRPQDLVVFTLRYS